MELTTTALVFYFALWGIFYGFLSHYIARRSVAEWVAKFDKDVNPKGADLLLHLLEPVLEQIEADQIETLADFKQSFFASVAPQVREAKKMVRELNPMGAALDELTKDNPLLGLIFSHVKLPQINIPTQGNGETAQNTPRSATDNPFTPGKIK